MVSNRDDKLARAASLSWPSKLWRWGRCRRSWEFSSLTSVCRPSCPACWTAANILVILLPCPVGGGRWHPRWRMSRGSRGTLLLLPAPTWTALHLKTTHYTLYTAHCTLHNALCTRHTAPSTLHSLKCTLHTAHCYTQVNISPCPAGTPEAAYSCSFQQMYLTSRQVFNVFVTCINVFVYRVFF